MRHFWSHLSPTGCLVRAKPGLERCTPHVQVHSTPQRWPRRWTQPCGAKVGNSLHLQLFLLLEAGLGGMRREDSLLLPQAWRGSPLGLRWLSSVRSEHGAETQEQRQWELGRTLGVWLLWCPNCYYKFLSLEYFLFAPGCQPNPAKSHRLVPGAQGLNKELGLPPKYFSEHPRAASLGQQRQQQADSRAIGHAGQQTGALRGHS